LDRFHKGSLLTSAIKPVKITETAKENLQQKFLLENKFEKDYDFPFDVFLVLTTLTSIGIERSEVSSPVFKSCSKCGSIRQLFLAPIVC
jgi:hypothetical protein